MMISTHLWTYLAHFFIEWKMSLSKVVEKIETHILCSIIFFRKLCRFWNNFEKYVTTGETTADSKIQRVCFSCWIPKATNTHSKYVIVIALPLQQLHERATLLLYVRCLSCSSGQNSSLVTEERDVTWSCYYSLPRGRVMIDSFKHKPYVVA
jgi:hypothetical protein